MNKIMVCLECNRTFKNGKYRMFDIDGTNLEEKEVCPYCLSDDIFEEVKNKEK